ncbi:F-box only protein 32-like [Liolophura sinensis]|uniref:F-box only protein 32-like n=1 Tax=Liolophura sinensis TaxID=3198878 RepID=UPI0031598E6E
MPFLGRDWRSPGDQWVRTTEGWEKLRLWRVKLFENLNANILARLMKLALQDWYVKKDFISHGHQPHMLYVKGNSKERKIPTSLSEAFIRLDMAGAVKDIRRFNYVLKVIQHLLVYRLSNLSGTSQKHIFHILEEMVNHVITSGNNVNTTMSLLDKAEMALTDGQTSHIGSAHLWARHKQSINKMRNLLVAFQIKQREEDGKVLFGDLPDDCIRDILFRLADHKDVLHTGMTNTSIYDMSQEVLLWKQLCMFHFTPMQLLTFLPQETQDDNPNWKYLYRRCVKRFGRKDVYADMLALCLHCQCLFWQSIGHPCVNDNMPTSQKLTPEAFLKLFAL